MTQAQKVVDYMNEHGSITTLQAFLDLGVTRLASRIHDISGMGIGIERETVRVETRDGGTAYVTRYRLA